MVYITLKNIKFIITANTRTLSKQIILNNYDFNQKYQTMIIIGGSLKVQMYRFNQKNYEPPGPSPPLSRTHSWGRGAMVPKPTGIYAPVFYTVFNCFKT